jgi:hypothetical protein
MASRQRRKAEATAVHEKSTSTIFTIQRRHRYWEVRDPAGELVCLTVYKCGAAEVIRRLTA